MSSATFDKMLVLLGPSLKSYISRYQNEKVHATRRRYCVLFSVGYCL